ncbi:hypothetical protein SBA4_3350003 [Candidatus Sulfopaludibacter sp. SbA4]|nr:hypothetical protein SBA4_3350003 [Candidatus Sulfopaludibacter sp. SbA4]
METIIGEGGLSDKASIALSASKNRRIPSQRMHERSPQSIHAAKLLHTKGSRQLRSLRSTCNCVGMVFANRRTFIEPEQIPMIRAERKCLGLTHVSANKKVAASNGNVAVRWDAGTAVFWHCKELALLTGLSYDTSKTHTQPKATPLPG